MTTPTQDRDITATLSAPREEPTAEALEAAAGRLLRSGHMSTIGDYFSATGEYAGESWIVFKLPNGWAWSSGEEEHTRHPTAQAAAVDLLRHHPELWPADPDETAPEPQPLTVAAREALRLLVDADHGDDDGPVHHRCYVCSERWPCEVEQARRILADALDTDARAAAMVAVDALQQEDR